MIRRALLLPVALLCLAGSLTAQEGQAKAKALVKQAVAFAKANGKEALLKEVNNANGRFHVKSGEELYIFVYDMEGLCLGMGFQTQAIGTNRSKLKDPDGKVIFVEFTNAIKATGSGWADYRFPNPKTGKIEQKTTYLENLDGWMIGCGTYK
jgi:signal transduction histidine kinase